jgi:hypothetical protein
MAPGGRDWFGAGNKYITPVVADGRVYVATATGVAAFGLRVIPPPIFSQPPHAASNPNAGNFVTLSTLTTDASYPESALTYTWGAILTPPGASVLGFGANASNAAKSTVAAVSGPGTYIFLVVVTDPSGNQTNCLALVNVVAPATSHAAAAALPSTGSVSHPAAAITPATENVSSALAPAAPATGAPVTPIWGTGRLMLIAQEPPAPAMSLGVYPLGDRRPFGSRVLVWPT